MEYLKTTRKDTPVAQGPTERSDLTDAELGFIPTLMRRYDCAAEERGFWAVSAFDVIKLYDEHLPLHIKINLFSEIVRTRKNYDWNIVRPLCSAALDHGSFRATRALEYIATNGPEEFRADARECLAKITEAERLKE